MGKEENTNIEVTQRTSSNKLSKLYFVIYLLLIIPFVSLFMFILYDFEFQYFFKGLLESFDEEFSLLTIGPSIIYFSLLLLINFVKIFNFYQKWIIATIIYYLGFYFWDGYFLETLLYTPYYFILALIVYFVEKYIVRKVLKN